MRHQLDAIETHWLVQQSSFQVKWREWISVFRDLMPIAGGVLSALEGRRALPENCAYLLLSKGMNHSLAMYLLLSKGLVVDASLSARNAIETFLMLVLFATDPDEKYFEEWGKGKKFKPSWVRNKVGKLRRATVRDAVIEFDDDYCDTVELAYGFWSDITHSNFQSSQHTVTQTTNGGFMVHTAGSHDAQELLINCDFMVVCSAMLRSAMTVAAVFDMPLLEKIAIDVALLQGRMSRASRGILATAS